MAHLLGAAEDKMVWFQVQVWGTPVAVAVVASTRPHTQVHRRGSMGSHQPHHRHQSILVGEEEGVLCHHQQAAVVGDRGRRIPRVGPGCNSKDRGRRIPRVVDSFNLRYNACCTSDNQIIQITKSVGKDLSSEALRRSSQLRVAV